MVPVANIGSTNLPNDSTTMLVLSASCSGLHNGDTGESDNGWREINYTGCLQRAASVEPLSQYEINIRSVAIGGRQRAQSTDWRAALTINHLLLI